jgi:GDP-L-fucose synthase
MGAVHLYGPGDDFHPAQSHVLPARIRHFHEAVLSGAAEEVTWGTGRPRHEFLYVDDLVAALLFVLDLPKVVYDAHTQPILSHINVGSGKGVSILELAKKVASITDYNGRILTDPTKPDGTLRKLMDVSRLEQRG